MRLCGHVICGVWTGDGAVSGYDYDIMTLMSSLFFTYSEGGRYIAKKCLGRLGVK